jgi:hypothetical protein
VASSCARRGDRRAVDLQRKFVTKAAQITEGDPYLYDKLLGDYVVSINEVQERQLRASVGID